MSEVESGMPQIERLSDEQYLVLNPKTVARAILNLEREYARTDAVLENLAVRLEEMASALRELISGNDLDKTKKALYELLFPGGELAGLMTEERFSEWKAKYRV